MSEFIEIFIEQESNNISVNSMNEINKFLPYYKNINNDNLAYLFAYFHFKFNNLFEFLNYKIDVNRHYNADSSRELISIINDERNLYNELKNSIYSFYIEEEYLNLINLCEPFLSQSGGSSIPEDFNKIATIKSRPIFYLNSTVNIKNSQVNLKLIGEGSYAKVLKYKDESYDKYFAIKKANKDLNEKELERFKIEFETMKKANSPYILEVYIYNQDDSSYIMEYADLTLFKYIEQNNTKLKLPQRIGIINQIFRAFEYIHQNIGLHRDISITNILLKKYDNDLLVIKVSDFGLVKLKNSTLTSDNTDFKGSLNDPKLNVVGGFKNYVIEHETYALTRLIYFILTGRVTINMKFDNKDFEIFIHNGISDNLIRRYKNIQEMKIAFNKIKFSTKN
ncbi:MAG: protein kinase family protein [Aliarcobacter sp.]|nr:protein kinase family protein [Aliarcobacter sp.]